jgi:RimJ/RimL family protein N-acetyltransferase
VRGGPDGAVPTLAAGPVRIVPLSAADAVELAPLLDDPALHEFTGGEPLSYAKLEQRYRRLERGAPAGVDERWLNWVIRLVDDGRAIGTVQATVRGREAAVAWVVARPWQGRGLATAAARALVTWLLAGGHDVRAHIRPGHVASERVARAAGLESTEEWFEGERVWRVSPARR